MPAMTFTAIHRTRTAKNDSRNAQLPPKLAE